MERPVDIVYWLFLMHSVKAEYDDQYSLDETVLDLESIRSALNLEKWAFAGHSTGGMLALKYAILKLVIR